MFNLEALVLGYHGTFCLVDEVQLGSSTTEGRLKVSSSGIVALPAELQQCGALITSWPKTDHRHMLDFLESWMAQEGDASMLTHWQSQEKSIDNSSSRGVALGYLAYEIVVQVGVVLRANEALGISEDCWRLVYPNDLQDAANSSTLSSLLRIFFPQLRGVEGLGIGDEDVVVKYFAHRLAPPLTHAPALEASSMYQTFGTLADPALAILSRLDANVSFHDIVLQAR